MWYYAHKELFVHNNSMIERMVGSTSSANNVHGIVNDNNNSYRCMVMDAMRMNQGNSQCLIVGEEPNVDATMFFYLLKKYNEPLWDGCTNHSKLLVVAQVFIINSDYGLSEVGYDRIVEWTRNILLKGIGYKRTSMLLNP